MPPRGYSQQPPQPVMLARQPGLAQSGNLCIFLIHFFIYTFNFYWHIFTVGMTNSLPPMGMMMQQQPPGPGYLNGGYPPQVPNMYGQPPNYNNPPQMMQGYPMPNQGMPPRGPAQNYYGSGGTSF